MPITPGPWKARYTKKHSDDGNIVISPGNGLVATDLTEDNARAIAALPALIAALQSLLAADAAILAIASGQRHHPGFEGMDKACVRKGRAIEAAHSALAAAGVEP